MPRKIFISVLGTGYYKKTNYFLRNKENAVKTHFVQEATLKLFANNWNANDKAFIFLTNKARTTNWEPPAQTNNDKVKNGKNKTYKGLYEILKTNCFPFHIKDIDIPDGNNEDEIWQIFETVFNVMEENDEVYFDITHALRSLPMLVMVLINYAKFLKNITVKSITYGNWEGRDNNNFAPILNLTAFSELQDWTSAANDFISYGKVKKLSELTKKDISPLAKEHKGKNITVNSLSKLCNVLPDFVNNIETCRGKSIIKNKEGNIINKELNNVRENLISPLTPILNKIKEKTNSFSEEDNLINGLHAANWCLNNNLLQQGFTILQETIISIVCKEIKINCNMIENRNIVKSCFNINKNKTPEKEWIGDAGKNKELTKKVLQNSKLINSLSKDFRQISNIRNDLNHFGYKKNPISSKKIYNLLKTLISNTEKHTIKSNIIIKK